MSYNLLTDLNKIAKEEDEYKILYETTICDLFECDIEDLEKMAELWEAAKESKESTELTEQVGRASQDRAGEREWVEQAAAEAQAKKDPSTSLGIQSDRVPEVGNMVALGHGMGTIVGVEPTDELVSIKDTRTGQEKVFKFANLAGPKMVNGKMAWKLNA